MFHIVIPETDDAPQDHVGGFKTDGTVGRVLDDPGRPLDQVDVFQTGVAIQHVFQQLGQRAQAHPAGHAFAAGLGVAQAQECQGKVHRAQTRRAGDDAPFHIAVKPLYHLLGGVGGSDIQSAHRNSPPCAAHGRVPRSSRENEVFLALL